MADKKPRVKKTKVVADAPVVVEVAVKKPRAKKTKVEAAPVVEYVAVDLGKIVDEQIAVAQARLHKQIDDACAKALADLNLKSI